MTKYLLPAWLSKIHFYLMRMCSIFTEPKYSTAIKWAYLNFYSMHASRIDNLEVPISHLKKILSWELLLPSLPTLKMGAKCWVREPFSHIKVETFVIKKVIEKPTWLPLLQPQNIRRDTSVNSFPNATMLFILTRWELLDTLFSFTLAPLLTLPIATVFLDWIRMKILRKD